MVKTQDDAGRKVFINMCGSDKIGAPSAWEGGVVPDAVHEQLKNMETMSEAVQEQMRFPLSLSEPRNDLDKSNEPCTVFDCALSSHIMKSAASLRALKVFIIEMAISWIQSKYKMNLDQRFKLPKLRYKGDTIQPQNIRKDKKSLILEVNDVDDVDDDEVALPLRVRPIPKEKQVARISDGTALLSRAVKDSVPPQAEPAAGSGSVSMSYGDITVTYNERPCVSVQITVQLPSQRQWQAGDVTMRAGIDAVHVNAAECGPRVIPLNVYVKPESVSSNLRGSVLHIKAGYYPIAEVFSYMEASKPLAVGALDLQSASMMEELD